MIHKIYSFFDNDLRYNVLIPLIMSLPLFILFSLSHMSLFWEMNIKEPEFIYELLLLMSLLIGDGILLEISSFCIVLFSLIAIISAIISRIIYSSENIQKYRKLMILCYVFVSLEFILFCSPLLILIIVMPYLAVFFIIAVLLIVCLIRRGIKNTLSESMLNFCKGETK